MNLEEFWRKEVDLIDIHHLDLGKVAQPKGLDDHNHYNGAVTMEEWRSPHRLI